MGRFSGADEAKDTGGGTGVYVGPGGFLVEILVCKQGTTRKKKDFFVAELFVHESTNPERPVGSTMAWMVTIDRSDEDTIDRRLNDIKKFIAVATGAPVAEVTEAVIEMVTTAENPLAGKRLRCSATNVKTTVGGTFTKCTWMAPEGVAATKAA